MTAPAKACGTCNLCCKLVAVDSLGKDAGTWCTHARPGKGCGIYQDRPGQCAAFQCFWLENEDLPAAWKPETCKFVIHVSRATRTLAVEVDPGSPDAWKREPFYSEFKRWSVPTRVGMLRVMVHVGRRTWIVFPEEDLFVGETRLRDSLSSGYLQVGALKRPAARVMRDGVETEYLGALTPL